MPTEGALNQIYYDSNGHRYVIDGAPAGCDSSAENWRTGDGALIRLASRKVVSKESEERLHWLCDPNNPLRSNRELLLPESMLINCKSDVYGCVFFPSKDVPLSFLIQQGPDDKLYKWFFDLTGGISYRLKIGYQLAKQIGRLHNNGILLNSICPENLFIDKYRSTETQDCRVEILATEKISTYSRKAPPPVCSDYLDPMVALRIAEPSSYSDTYSYAVTLFQMFTMCHPFETINENEYMSCTADYIGDPQGNNYSEKYEDNSVFLPEALKELFCSIFTTGKFDLSQRPSIEDFASACVKGINQLSKCETPACNKEYNDNGNHVCPFCLQKAKKGIYVKSISRISQTSKIIMPLEITEAECSLAPIESVIATKALIEGTNYLPKSFCDESIPVNEDKRLVALHVDKSKTTISVFNLLKKHAILVNGTKLLPYDKSKNNYLQVKFLSDVITIDYPENLNLLSEQIINGENPEYGHIEIKKLLLIERG